MKQGRRLRDATAPGALVHAPGALPNHFVNEEPLSIPFRRCSPAYSAIFASRRRGDAIILSYLVRDGECVSIRGFQELSLTVTLVKFTGLNFAYFAVITSPRLPFLANAASPKATERSNIVRATATMPTHFKKLLHVRQTVLIVLPANLRHTSFEPP